MHELSEEGVTLCVLAARAHKTTIEIDVIADDPLHRAVRIAVKHGIEPVSCHGNPPELVQNRVLAQSRVNERRFWGVLGL